MNYTKRRFLKPHRFARIVRWATTMLAWLALVLSTNMPAPHRRRVRQRYCFASPGWVERLARALAVVRVVEMTGIKKRLRPALRNAAAGGFRRRVSRCAMMRATVGSRFRKTLKARDPHDRLKLLLHALGDIDAFARRYLVSRTLRRLTKLHAIVPFAPVADALRQLWAPMAGAADSS